MAIKNPWGWPKIPIPVTKAAEYNQRGFWEFKYLTAKYAANGKKAWVVQNGMPPAQTRER